MTISTFDLFTIGLGPSSSHTVGPMRAAKLFAETLYSRQCLSATKSVACQLYGSLGATGKGHGTDKAIIAGLAGLAPETAEQEELTALYESVASSRTLLLLGKQEIRFQLDEHLQFQRETLPPHSNTMVFSALDVADSLLESRKYCSIGGGFVVEPESITATHPAAETSPVPFPFASAAELLELCRAHGKSISDLMLENEKRWNSETAIRVKLQEIWQVMQDCVAQGCRNGGCLPGGLQVKRRAPDLFQKLKADTDNENRMTWVDLWAIAVNEENAAGGRVVTAPTNGAAGIIPAVLHYHQKFCTQQLSAEQRQNSVVRFLLTASAIGQLFKLNASISGAEVGCQGEVGSACSMAAAGLTEVLGGTPAQVENAAEIGMEHHLGLTCDPVGGLVQVPCIERNAMAAVTAINSAQLALQGDGTHCVSLDRVIKTMRDTGRDMLSKYKETSRGGLAVNVTEC